MDLCEALKRLARSGAALIEADKELSAARERVIRAEAIQAQAKAQFYRARRGFNAALQAEGAAIAAEGPAIDGGE